MTLRSLRKTNRKQSLKNYFSAVEINSLAEIQQLLDINVAKKMEIIDLRNFVKIQAAELVIANKRNEELKKALRDRVINNN